MAATDPGAQTAPEATEAAPEGQATETTAQPTSQPDGGLDRLYERMDAMTRKQAELMENFQQFTQPYEPEPELYDDGGELTEEGARQVIADLVREGIQAELGPREQARAIEKRDDAWEALKEEYTDLQDPKISEPLLMRAVAWAKSIDPSIVDRPEFVDVVEAFYAQSKYGEIRAQQAAEQPRPVVLESGSGARHQQQPKEDWGDRIVKAAERLRPQI